MTTTGIIVMTSIVGFVWGGLLFIMTTAARKERAKRGSGELDAS